jgi:hypothetical protein
MEYRPEVPSGFINRQGTNNSDSADTSHFQDQKELLLQLVIVVPQCHTSIAMRTMAREHAMEEGGNQQHDEMRDPLTQSQIGLN